MADKHIQWKTPQDFYLINLTKQENGIYLRSEYMFSTSDFDPCHPKKP